jgi:hypothetical protein
VRVLGVPINILDLDRGPHRVGITTIVTVMNAVTTQDVEVMPANVLARLLVVTPGFRPRMAVDILVKGRHLDVIMTTLR